MCVYKTLDSQKIFIGKDMAYKKVLLDYPNKVRKFSTECFRPKKVHKSNSI